MSECKGIGPDGRHLGCCGYDELAVKPATTRPLTFANITKPAAPFRQQKEIEGASQETQGRARIQVKAVEEAAGQKKIPTQIGAGRLLDGKTTNLFGQSPAALARPERQRVIAQAMGQNEPEVGPNPVVEAVLKREAPPQGLTKGEASTLASDLQNAIEKTELALNEGGQCLNVDQGVLENVKKIQSDLIDFSTDGPENVRADIAAEDLSLIERVFECSAIYAKKKEAEKTATMAFVAGGLLIGTIVLVVVS